MVKRATLHEAESSADAVTPSRAWRPRRPVREDALHRRRRAIAWNRARLRHARSDSRRYVELDVSCDIITLFIRLYVVVVVNTPNICR